MPMRIPIDGTKKKKTKKGLEMVDFIDHNNLVMLNRRYQPPTRKSGTNIDLTLATTNTSQLVKSWTFHPETLSDHNLILLEIAYNRATLSREIDKFNTKHANFEAVNRAIANRVLNLSNMPTETNDNAVESLVRAYQKTIETSCQELLPKIKIRDKHNLWWNLDLTRLRAETNKLRQKHQNCCPCRAKLVYMGQFRRKSLEYKHLIRDAKKNSWRSFMTESSKENPYSLPYKVAAEKVAKKEVITSLRKGNNFTKTGLETMSLLIETLIPPDDPLQEDENHLEVRKLPMHN